MAEWPNAAVLKTAVLQGTGGSNPPASAMRPIPRFVPTSGLVFALAFLTAVPHDAAQGACAPPAHWPVPTPIPGGGARYGDIAYGPAARHRLDVYLPAGWTGNEDVATLFFLHGGGWYGGDKRDPAIVPLFHELTQRGHPVVVPRYRLAPANGSGSMPLAVRDVRTALGWIRRPADGTPVGPELCLPDCVAAIGTSAGAHLAALCGTLWQGADGNLFAPYAPAGGVDPGADLRCDLVIGFSGFYDFELFAQGHCPQPSCQAAPFTPAFPDPGSCGPNGGFPAGYPTLAPAVWAALSFGQLPNGTWPPEFALGCEWNPTAPCTWTAPDPTTAQDLTGDRFRDVSPRHWIDASDAAFVLIHGTCDPISPVRQSRNFRDALLLAGLPAALRESASQGHGLRDTTNGSGLFSTQEGADEIEEALLLFELIGGCERARAIPYGCGINPRASLIVADGTPRIGTQLDFEITNPAGTQQPGTIPVLSFSFAALPGFPCGIPLAGFGMDGPFGELLISVAGSNPVARVIGTPWGGIGQPSLASLVLPLDTAFVGRALYAQALLVDTSPPLGLDLTLSAAIELRIGP